MGIDQNGLRFLLASKKSGVSFRKTIMIGRQGLHVSDFRLAAVLRESGIPMTIEGARGLISQGNGYAEPLLRLLGAEEIYSIDASSFEGASHIQDLNIPLGGEWDGQFSAVIDGGSLEHIFNFPVAIANCMRLVDEGGHFITFAPTNNQMGHGLYQFSPDLYFRVLCKENGFRVELCVAAEDTLCARWYEVSDPAEVGARVGVQNNMLTYLYVRAKRTERVAPFSTVPQQSDYSAHWLKGIPGKRPMFHHNQTAERIKVALSPTVDIAKRLKAVWKNLRPFHKRLGLRPYKFDDAYREDRNSG